MRVLHVLASGSVNWGGPPIAVFELARGLSKLGVSNSVVTLDETPYPRYSIPENIDVHFCGDALIPRLGIPGSWALVHTLRREIARTDLVHLHELWHLPQAVGSIMSKLSRKPYVVSPHGAVEPFFGGNSRLKSLAWHTYQRQVLRSAAIIHAINENEKELLSRSVGLSRIETVPNGIDIDRVDRFLRQANEESGGRMVPSPPFLLFLGRMTPKKGVAILLDSFRLLAGEFPRMKLVIAGPDPLGYAPSFKDQAAKLGLGGRVLFEGLVTEPFKYALLAAAEAFVLPSTSEGFSMAVLEALTCGTPVVVSVGCHLPEVESSGAGFVVELTTDSLSRALRKIIMDDRRRGSMGAAARRLVEERFSDTLAARAMVKLYNDALRTE
jgi:glycosyltransferase involved in cell wall biosynthesis